MSTDAQGATINPYAQENSDGCKINRPDGTPITGQKHKFHWVWENGVMTKVVRCATCGLEKENDK